MTLKKFVACVNAWLFCHDTLCKAEIISVNAGSFLLLPRQAECAFSHISDLCDALEAARCPVTFDLSLFFLYEDKEDIFKNVGY